MKFRMKSSPPPVEAITFDELVEHGKANGANIVNGMPWSFSYQGRPISHENDDCYLIPTSHGHTLRLSRGEILITAGNGELYTCPLDVFAELFEAE